jgi:transposase
MFLIRSFLKGMRGQSGDVGCGDDREDQACAFVEGKSIKQICRELRLSRNTVRKVIRSGATEFTYDRTTQPRPKIDPWPSELDDMLAENARRPKRERLTLIRIYEELRNRGYDGSYDAVRRYAGSWSKATHAFISGSWKALSTLRQGLGDTRWPRSECWSEPSHRHSFKTDGELQRRALASGGNLKGFECDRGMQGLSHAPAHDPGSASIAVFKHGRNG